MGRSRLPILRHRTVLVVESDPSVRLFLERALRKTEAVVITAEDAESALGILTLVQPDLILMDLVQPGLSGLSLARRLRRDRRWRETKLVALTRLCGPILTETMWAAGIDAHVDTPLTVRELGAVLRRLLTAEEPASPRNQP
jgi:two-component system, OmpR family, phosphate regulon response regulator PhoB